MNLFQDLFDRQKRLHFLYRQRQYGKGRRTGGG
jgi:hypothetical protein